MKKLLIIGGSTHSDSINRTLAKHAGSQIQNAELTVLDLNDFEMPIFSEDREETDGIPEAARKFLELIQASDGIVLSLAEHNGSYSAAFKNILDWTSRHERSLWSEKPMLLLAASPGGRGGASVLASAESYFPHLGARVVATFSLPSFHDNFSEEKGIIDPELHADLAEVVAIFSTEFSLETAS